MRQKRRGGEREREREGRVCADGRMRRQGGGVMGRRREAAESLSWMEGWRKHARQEVEINTGEKEKKQGEEEEMRL